MGWIHRLWNLLHRKTLEGNALWHGTAHLIHRCSQWRVPWHRCHNGLLRLGLRLWLSWDGRGKEIGFFDGLKPYIVVAPMGCDKGEHQQGESVDHYWFSLSERMG